MEEVDNSTTENSQPTEPTVEPVTPVEPIEPAPEPPAAEPAEESMPEVFPSEAELQASVEPAPVKPASEQSVESEVTDAGVMARLKMFLRDKLLNANRKRQEKAEAHLEMIMSYTREHGKITNDEVEHLVKVKDRQALRYLGQLVKQGRLVRFGTKKNTFYKIVN